MTFASTLTRGLRGAAACAAALSVALTANAAITGTTGTIVARPAPPSVALGALESNQFLPAFSERQGRVLTAPLAVDITLPGVYDPSNPALTPGVLPPGTTVSSYFVHGDAVAVGPVVLSGTITFDEDIIGIVVTDGSLDASDALLGSPGTVYATGVPQRGLNFSGDKLVLQPNLRTVEVGLPIFGVTDQIRIITRRPRPPGMTFSMDFQGPSRGVVSPWGRPVFEGDILTTASNPPLGPWLPEFVPPTPPGPVIQSAAGAGFNLGLEPGANGIVEVDALSYGRERGFRLRFSVDEWATGNGGAVNSVIAQVAPPFPFAEAAADVFTYLSPIFAPGLNGNVQWSDGNGDTWPGVGLIEPNPAGPGQPDGGDNLDALDLQTTAAMLAGPVFLSLDAAFVDPLEGGAANSGTAVANGFVGGDVIVVRNTAAASPMPAVYAPANMLGLDLVQGGGTDSDDLDALALFEDGDGIFSAQFGIFDGSTDWILFSVRRGSAVIGRIDSRLGIPIDAGDILTVPAPGGGSPFPAIMVPAERLGLNTIRNNPLCGTTPIMDVSAGCDDVDAIDTFIGSDADSDGDGFLDDVDNCTQAANPSQFDADADGYGNACDGDLNNDCAVNPIDLGIMSVLFFTPARLADFNEDGIVNAIDLGLMKLWFFQPPGPGLGFCP